MTRIFNTADFGKAIRQRRKELHYTQSFLSEFTGFSASFISDLENGKPTAELGKALYLASILGLDCIIYARGEDIFGDQIDEQVSEQPLVRKVELEKVFESEKIIFVKPSECLVKDYLDMVNDKENVGRFFGGAHRESYTKEDEISWVRKKRSEAAPVYSMIEKQTGDFIGNVELMDMALSQAELGIAITARKQNKGYGTEAVKALTRYGLKEMGLRRIFLRTNPSNLRAIHVYEKCGYAEFDRTEEHVWMEYRGEKK